MAKSLSPAEEAGSDLFEHAKNVAASKGYKFFDAAESLLREMFRAATLEDSRRLMAAPGPWMAEVKPKVERLVAEMIAEAAAIRMRDPTYVPNMLGETTFRGAMCKICPLPPFCYRKPDYCG